MDPEEHLRDMTARDWEVTEPGPLRVAVVGLGWWTREYALPALVDAENCRPTAAVSGSADKREQVRAEYDHVETTLDYREYEEGVESDAYDAVYICTPNAQHLEHAEVAARQGAAVLCEKPMEVDPDRAARLVAACEDAAVPLMVGYRLQTDPALRSVRALLRDGIVGDPVEVHSSMSQQLLEVIPDPDQWRLDPSLVGPGTAVMNIGVYPLNTTRFLLDAVPDSVSATMRSETEPFARVPDEHASFTVDYESGVTAQCSVSESAYFAGHWRVVGTEGELLLEPAFYGEDEQRLRIETDAERIDGTVSSADAGSVTLTKTWMPDDQMRHEFEYFAQRVLADDPIEPDGEHALVDVETIEAIYEAADRGRTVDVTK